MYTKALEQHHLIILRMSFRKEWNEKRDQVLIFSSSVFVLSLPIIPLWNSFMLLLILTLYAKQRGIFEAVPRSSVGKSYDIGRKRAWKFGLQFSHARQSREEIVQYSAKLNVSERAILFDVPISIKAGNMIHAVVVVVR